MSKVCADSPGTFLSVLESKISIAIMLTWSLAMIGMTTETTVLVTIRVDLPENATDFPEPKQKLDEGEFVRKKRFFTALLIMNRYLLYYRIDREAGRGDPR